MKDLYQILREERELKGYSQEYVAVQLDVSSSTISRWERGSSAMTIEQILAYTHVLGIDYYELFASAAQKNGKVAGKISLHLEICDNDAYKRILNIIGELGFSRVIIQTKT